MKIGFLNCFGSIDEGAILQGFALQGFCKEVFRGAIFARLHHVPILSIEFGYQRGAASGYLGDLAAKLHGAATRPVAGALR